MFINTRPFSSSSDQMLNCKGEGGVVFACHPGASVFIFTGSVMSPDFMMPVLTTSINFLFSYFSCLVNIR